MWIGEYESIKRIEVEGVVLRRPQTEKSEIMDSSFQQIVSYEKNEKQLISNFQQEDIIAHILISN